MDFYGFSNGVQQANQQAQSSDLANSAYNMYNAGAENAWRQNQFNAMNSTITADKKRGTTDDDRTTREEVEQGGGTAVGFGGVVALGKGIKDTTNKVSKAIRIGEAQLEIAKNSGTAADISKASKLLDVAKSGNLSEFSKVAAQYVGERALGKSGAANVNRIVNLAQDINRGSTSYGSAARSVITSQGRKAASVINDRATEIAEQAKLPDEPEEDAGGDIADNSSELQEDLGPEPEPEALADDGTTARSAGETSVNAGEDATTVLTEGGGTAASAVAQRAIVPTANTDIPTPEVDDVDVQGVEGRPDTFQTTRVSEQQFGDLYEDPRGDLTGFEDEATNPDAFVIGKSDDAGGIVGKVIDGGATNLTAQSRYMAVGTESSGFRGIVGTIGKRFGGQIDLTSGVSNPLADVDEAVDLGRNVGTSRNVAQSISVLGNQSNPTETISNLAKTADESSGGVVATRVADIEAREPAPAEAPTSETPPETNTETGQIEEVATEAPTEVATEAPRPSGSALDIGNEASQAARDAGTAANTAAIEEGGGIDTRALEVGAEAARDAGGVAGRVGSVALRSIGALGKGLKIAGPVANVAFLGDQTYNEVSSLVSGKGLSGDGTIGKVGGVMQEIGDAAATYGSYLALAGPVGDVAALGVELGGGLLSLAGDLLSDEGTKEKEAKEKTAQQNKLKADQKAQQATLSATNTDVEIAGAGGSANLAGRGAVAQVSQSAVRAF